MSDTNTSGREQIGVPVGEVADTRPVTDHQSKKVMLRAERKDTVLIDDSFTAEVVERQNGYYGPRLTLWSERRGKNYELHGLSFDTGLLLWESVTNEDGFRTGWRKVGEVSAEIAATKPYKICKHCELPIRSLQHERFSALGLCERMEKPNEWGKGTGDDTGSDGDDGLRTDGGHDVASSGSDRLFVPLKSEFYTAFDVGGKDVELRGLSPRFNHRTVYTGRTVELRRGYSTDDSLWGEVGEVWLFPSLQEIPSELDHRRIAPYDNVDYFLGRAADLLGDYDRFIAFSVTGIDRQLSTGSSQSASNSERGAE